METGGSGSNCRCHGNEYRTGDTGTGIKNRKREECGHYRKSREKRKDYDSKGNL